MLKRIISGGQTGVDCAALDAALDSNFPCGGFCPKGRIVEDGVIANKYPLQEHQSSNYAQRTLENVLQGDGTLIIYFNELKGGTALTSRFCKNHQKRFILINANECDYSEATKAILSFVQQHEIETLNVAGPRKSQWPDGYSFTYQCVKEVIENII